MRAHYTTSGVCSRFIDFDVRDGRVYDVVFTGGCNGNLKAIGKLVDGMRVEDVIDKLEGNTCGMRPTSCGDQLAQALKKACY